MIHLPTTVAELDSIDRPAEQTVLQAGGTDLQERLRSNNARLTIVDLGAITALVEISPHDEVLRIGAGVTIATVAEQAAEQYPALALTAAGLATPQCGPAPKELIRSRNRIQGRADTATVRETRHRLR